MSTNFNAGIDSSNVVMRYGEEAIWDAVPAIAFTEVRLTGESFSEQKTRTRPEEIKADGFVSHALTTQVQATGGLNFALSFGTYDDLLEGLLNGDFTADLAIDAITVDIVVDATLAGGGIGFTSTLTDKFNTIVEGQWFRTSGWVSGGLAVNGIYRAVRVVTGASPELEVSATAGDGGTLAALDSEVSVGDEKFRGKMLRNGVVFHSYFFEKQLSPSLFLRYSGSYINDGNLTAQVGGFLEGTFNFLCASETSDSSTAGTGPANGAPAGRVIDTVAGFSNLEVNDVAISAVVQGISWTVTKNNARAQYGLGQAEAQGMARGTIDVSGTMSVYFTDFVLYQLYKDETDQIISFRALDDQGEGYIFTLPGVTLMNPTVVAGGPDSDVVSEFALEGNGGSGDYDGVIMQIDSIPSGVT